MDHLITDPALTQLTVSGIIVWLYQKLKEAPWFPALSDATGLWTQRIVGMLLAIASAIGIQYTFDSAAGTLIVTGLTFSGIVAAGWAGVQAFVVQTAWYHGVIKPAPATASAAIIDQPKLDRKEAIADRKDRLA